MLARPFQLGSEGLTQPVFLGALRVLARAAAPVVIALVAGCAGPQRSASPSSPPPIAAQNAPGPIVAVTPEASPASATPDSVAVPPAAIVAAPGRTIKPPPTGIPPPSAAVSPHPTAAAPLRVPAGPPVQQAKAENAPKPTAPALDLKSLETRLRETKAIGVMTKLTLKNQVDDLLDHFRTFYQGKLKTSLVELRGSYDLLIMKVLALLQDADPPLAQAIVISREAIWSILADPVKFATV